MQDSSQQRLIVPLLGMHRSGTSLAARAFFEAGLPMGDRLMLDSAPDNVDGFWEDAEIVAVQDRLTDTLLRQAGVDSQYAHNACTDFPGGWLESEAAAEALVSLREILERRFRMDRVFGFKDPRTCRLVPLWRKLAAEMGTDMRAVLLTRAPSAVAGSLHARQGVPLAVGEALWLRAMADIFTDAGELVGLRLPYSGWRDAAPMLAQIRTFVAKAGLTVRETGSPFVAGHRHQTERQSPVDDIGEIHAAIEGGVNAGHVRDMIAILVDEYGGWAQLVDGIAPAYRKAELATGLWLAFPSTPNDMTSALPDSLLPCPAARAELLHGNRWTLNGWGGFRLHANSDGNPATLMWRDLPAPPAGEFTMRMMPSDQSSVPMTLNVSIKQTDGRSMATTAISLPTTREQAEIRIGFDNPKAAPLDLEITLAAASAGPAHNAWVFLTRPVLAPR